MTLEILSLSYFELFVSFSFISFASYRWRYDSSQAAAKYLILADCAERERGTGQIPFKGSTRAYEWNNIPRQRRDSCELNMSRSVIIVSIILNWPNLLLRGAALLFPVLPPLLLVPTPYLLPFCGRTHRIFRTLKSLLRVSRDFTQY